MNIKAFFISLLFFLFSVTSVNAATDITIVNPIRGDDFWVYPYSILETPKKQYDLISKNNLSATWLIRYDALKNPQVVDFLRGLNQQQEIGLFLEITPTLTKDAGVTYNQSPNWHYAKSVLLTGYSPDDRKKLIDQAFKRYEEIFNKHPESVGAWWIDANSLNYLHEKYEVEANLDVSDQYSTDQYQIWGQYFSLPFYPSKNNALAPARSIDQKIGVVTIQWASRDPYNAFGSGVHDSTYSVQVNDYLLHDLEINYFKRLSAIYPQLVIGLENDFDWKKFGSEYQKQIELTNRDGSKTMSEYAEIYVNKYPSISPDELISADDPLDSGGKVVWYQNTNYRVGWFYDPKRGSIIKDLRLYDQGLREDCFEKACDNLNLAAGNLSSIDEVAFKNGWLIDEGKIGDIKVEKNGSVINISYLTQSGSLKTVRFLANDIEVNGVIQPISVIIMNANKKSDEIQNKIGVESLDFKIDRIIPSLSIKTVKFLGLSMLFFLIPGYVLSGSLLVAIPLGVCLFTLVAYLQGFIFYDTKLLWLLPAISMVGLIKRGLPKIKLPLLNRQLLLIVFLVIIGSGSWLLTSVKNGLPTDYGFGYWGPHGHDSIWHLSLISELQRNPMPSNPVFAGESLKNYHYFYDLLLAKSGQIFALDSQDLLFRFFPLLISILCGLLMFRVVSNFKGFRAGFFATFFLYFGGSFGWLVSYFRKGDFGGESMFWSQQAISTLINPPFAISILIFLAGLILFQKWERQKDQEMRSTIPLIISLSLLWGILIEFKAYGGVLVLAALGLVALENIMIKKNFRYLAIFVLTSLISAMVFLPNNIGSNSLFVFAPLWLISTMIEFPDRLGWYRLSLTLNSGVPVKVIPAYLLGIVIFIVGNLGSRIVGLVSIKWLLQQRLLLYIFLLGLILPLLFIQKGTNWNVIQFFYYSIFIFNILAGISLATMSRIRIGQGIVLLSLVLTIPTTLDTLKHYLPQRPPAMLSNSEYQALGFLKTQPEGIVLTLPFDSSLRDKFTEPRPLYTYVTSAYVSAFSTHPTFVDDTINLEILGVDYKGRVSEQKDFANVSGLSKKILEDNHISYVYTLKMQDFKVDEGRMGLEKIFENREVEIFKVTR